MTFGSPLCIMVARKGGEQVCAKMGRPKLDNPKTIKLGVKIDKETLAKLDEIAKVHSLSRGQVVRQGIEALYTHIKK